MPQTAPPFEASNQGIEVTLDHGSLRGQMAGGETRYTVGLSGNVGEPWAAVYRRIQEASTLHRRFQLDRATRTVSFSCPNIEGPALVFEMLDRLEALLTLVEHGLGPEDAPPAPVGAFPTRRSNG